MAAALSSGRNTGYGGDCVFKVYQNGLIHFCTTAKTMLLYSVCFITTTRKHLNSTRCNVISTNSLIIVIFIIKLSASSWNFNKTMSITCTTLMMMRMIMCKRILMMMMKMMIWMLMIITTPAKTPPPPPPPPPTTTTTTEPLPQSLQFSLPHVFGVCVRRDQALIYCAIRLAL